MVTKYADNEEELTVSVIKASKEIESLWTVQDVAKFLRLKPGTVRTMARRGELPSMKIGKRVWRFRASDIKNLFLQNKGVDKS